MKEKSIKGEKTWRAQSSKSTKERKPKRKGLTVLKVAKRGKVVERGNRTEVNLLVAKVKSNLRQ